MGGRRLVKARRIQQEQKRQVEPVRQFSLGVLVGETDTSPTADVAGRPEYVWCSEFNQPQSKFSILNRAVQPVVGLTVKIGYPEKPPFERQVLGVWDQIGTLTDYDPSEGDPFAIPPHRVTHQWPAEADKGTDAVKVFSPALMPLKLEAVSGLNVMIRPLSAYWTGSRYRAFGGGVVDLAPYLPAAGMVRYVLLYLNTAVNGPGVVAGTAVTDDGITPIPLPDLPDNARPSGFIRLTGTQTAVSQVADVIDARDWLGLGNDGVPYEATQIGQILYSVDGATFEARLPVVSSEGFIITNEDGIIVVADEELPPYVPPPPPPPFVVTGGFRTSDLTTRKYDLDGNLLWSVDHGQTVWGVAVDSGDNIVTGGIRVGNETTRRYDTDGNLLWSRDHGATVNGVAVDGDGNVITVGDRTGNLTTRKYDPDGNLLWSRDHGATARGVAVDGDGNVITVGDRTGNLTTRKYDPDGNLLWSRDHGVGVLGVATDSGGNIVTGGSRLFVNQTTRKYDPDGNLLWTRDHGNVVWGVAIDSSDNIITGGTGSSNLTTRKYDPGGNLLWSVNHGSVVRGVTVDIDSNVITGGARTGDLTTRKYDPGGNLLWSRDHGDQVNGVGASI